METKRLVRLLDPRRPLTYGIVQAGPHMPDGVPYIRPVDMTDSQGVVDPEALQRTSPEIAAEYRRASVRPGDLVLSIGPSFGKVLIVGENLSGANLTQGTARLSPAEGVESRWLYWALQSTAVRQQWDAVVSGGTFRALNLGPLGETRLVQPEIEEQRRMADFLDEQVARLDAAAEVARVAGELAAERSRAAFIRMLLDDEPAGNRTAVKRLCVDERLGAWGDEPGTAFDVAVARVADFDRMSFSVSEVPTIRSLPRAQATARLLRSGDTLLERSGGTGDRPVGCAVTYLGTGDTPVICSNFISRIRPTAACHPRYLTLVLAAMYEARWNRPWFTQTTGIQNLDSSGYLRLTVPTRSLPAQERTAAAADVLLEQRRAIAGQAVVIRRLLEERRRALITACVTGEFDVTTASSRAAHVAEDGVSP